MRRQGVYCHERSKRLDFTSALKSSKPMTVLTAEAMPTTDQMQFWASQFDDAERYVATSDHEDIALANLRLLTEVEHFLADIDEYGDVDGRVFDSVVMNRRTAISEIAMPYAVTTTEHEVVYRNHESGRRERVIMWLGRTALEVADSGYQFHFSEAAHQRVGIEKAEARYAQENLRPGVAQVFISPRMSAKDAPREIAKAEHLYSDDSLRVSTAIVNEAGEVTGRRLQSLLVRDIPLASWVAMLKDPRNIFGKAFDLRDEESATSIMELFSQMDLPEDALPHGPVTLIEAVLPYITDEAAKRTVEQQLSRFLGDQEFYAREAEQAGQEWATFDLELARSLQDGWATGAVREFIMQNGDAWSDESLGVINAHWLSGDDYAMSTELAALLARGMQKMIGDQLSVVTDNDMAIQAVSSEDRKAIKEKHRLLSRARARGADDGHIRNLLRQMSGLMHRQSIRSGGGCSGDAETAFGASGQDAGVGELRNPFKSLASDEDSHGSRWFECPKGHLNYRREANILEKHCRECGVNVGCAPKESGAKKFSQERLTWKSLFRIGEIRQKKRAKVAPEIGKQAVQSIP